MEAHTHTCTTPDGPFSIFTTTNGVLASGWTENLDELKSLIHSTLCPTVIRPDESAILSLALDAVAAYYMGEFGLLRKVPVLQHGGTFQLSAWQALHEVQPAQRISYTQLAERAGNPRAVRAAASACANNAVALFVPCHRVLRADGSLGGFRYGLGIKQSLLARESAREDLGDHAVRS
jgi:methylated-DNA-[protein]-cysteine S-methyltransferase